jgi:hypothetical protein
VSVGLLCLDRRLQLVQVLVGGLQLLGDIADFPENKTKRFESVLRQ